jgi:hypothetical protein
MRSIVPAALFVLAAAIASPVAAVSPGETDDFSASTEGWFAGGGPMLAFPPTPPVLVSGGGPAGAADSFLRITSQGGSGSGSRLVAMNATQWAGDYLAAGVDAIEMDLRNLGTADLTIRLLFEDPAAGAGPVNIAATSAGAFLPAGSGWTRVRFDITPADLEPSMGNSAAALGGATFVRIFHSTQAVLDPLFRGEPIAATLGVDNISAVPEPGVVILMLAGLATIGVRRWQAA